jgi:hypothetical protein
MRHLRNRSVLFLIGIICVGSVTFTTLAQAETLIESQLYFRIYVAFSVDQKAVQAWLPDPWKAVSLPKGPFKGANLYVLFDDKLLNQIGEGKSAKAEVYHAAILVAFAKHPQTGDFGVFVIRVYSPHGGSGPYKNTVKATVRRGATLRGADLGPGTGTEVWRVQDSAGGVMEFWMDYQRAVPKRVKKEFKVRSSVEPDFFRIYRDDLTVDVLKSIQTGIDRVQNYQFRVTMSELRKIFDGSEQFVGISVNPIRVRQVFLP